MNIRLIFLLLTFSAQLSAQNFQKFTSSKDPRAKGLDFSIEYPSSWTILEPDRPNVVKNIMSPSGSEILVILVKKMPGIPDREQLAMVRKIMSTAEGLPSISIKSRFLGGSDKTVIDNLPASTLEYVSLNRVMETDVLARGLTYTILYEDYVVTLMFNAMDTDANRANAKYQANEFLFQRMAASFVLLTRWK